MIDFGDFNLKFPLIMADMYEYMYLKYHAQLS